MKTRPSKKQAPPLCCEIHDDDFFDEEEAEVLRFDNFTMPLSAAQT